jgi:hypothetical protein
MLRSPTSQRKNFMKHRITIAAIATTAALGTRTAVTITYHG